MGASVFLHFFGALVLQLIPENFLDGQLANRGHNEVEVLLGALVRHAVEKHGGLNFDSGRFFDKHAFQFLKHLQNLLRIHAPVIIRVAQLKHHYKVKRIDSDVYL